MELNEMEKRLLFQVEGDYQSKVLNELYMTTQYVGDPARRNAAKSLMENCAHCRMPSVWTWCVIFRKITGFRRQDVLSGKFMTLERFDPEVRHMLIFDVLSRDVFEAKHRPGFDYHCSARGAADASLYYLQSGIPLL